MMQRTERSGWSGWNGLEGEEGVLCVCCLLFNIPLHAVESSKVKKYGADRLSSYRSPQLGFTATFQRVGGLSRAAKTGVAEISHSAS